MSSEAPPQARPPPEADLTNSPESVSKPPTSPPPPSTTTNTPNWPALSSDHPLTALNLKVPDLVAQASHSEVFGIDLGDSSAPSFSRNLILQKFLRANANDVNKAADQLLGTLKWRKEFDPLAAVDEVFSGKKFGGLGFVTRVQGVMGSSNNTDVATFNIYGAVTNNKDTFGDTETFLRWRVALMELSIRALRLSDATAPIPDYGKGADPYQGFQIHDYMGVSFLRQDPFVKAASKEAIATFTKYYPETLSRKFFVNVPVVMGWVFGAMKMVVNAETMKKITVVTYAKDLAKELGEGVPEAYGGKGPALTTGTMPKTD